MDNWYWQINIDLWYSVDIISLLFNSKNMTIEIRKAERAKSKLRLGLAGPSGAGKTMSALKMAKGVAGPNGRVLMIDTERGSGDLYADLFQYDIITLTPPYAPKYYVEAIQAAEKAGYNVIIIDSLSHAWSDEGGLLDQADKLSNKGNSYTVWKDLTPQHRMLVNAMLNSPAHIIATVRSKQAYEMEEYTDQRGNKKVKPTKMGMAPVQREGMEYEFTVFMDIDTNHSATVSKDRTNMFKDEVFVIDEKVGERLLAWLGTGVDRELQNQKIKITQLIKILGWTEKELPGEFVKVKTSLDLVDENYAEIISRLDTLVQEMRENAKKVLSNTETLGATVPVTTA